ncbi:IS3 family transposase [Marinitoga sp. 38H-ov]
MKCLYSRTKNKYIDIIEDYINFYNNERFQSRLNNMAPVEYWNHVG